MPTKTISIFKLEIKESSGWPVYLAEDPKHSLDLTHIDDVKGVNWSREEAFHLQKTTLLGQLSLLSQLMDQHNENLFPLCQYNKSSGFKWSPEIRLLEKMSMEQLKGFKQKKRVIATYDGEQNKNIPL